MSLGLKTENPWRISRWISARTLKTLTSEVNNNKCPVTMQHCACKPWFLAFSVDATWQNPLLKHSRRPSIPPDGYSAPWWPVKGSATNALVQDTTRWSQRSRDHALTGQSLVWSRIRPLWIGLVQGHLTNFWSDWVLGVWRPGWQLELMVKLPGPFLSSFADVAGSFVVLGGLCHQGTMVP